MKRKLNFEMMPAGCWKSNLRTVLSKQAWDFIRKDTYARANGKCEICGKETKRIDAHEVWSYDVKKGVQKLEDVIGVCKDCHSVIHIGRTQLCGDPEKAENHYMEVNGCSYAEMRADLSEANKLCVEQSNVGEWKLDLTWLKKYLKND